MGFSIVQATDGRYVISGHCVGIDPVGWTDAYVININTDGTVNWQRGVGSQSAGTQDVFYSIAKTTDGGYIAAGVAYETAANSNSRDAYFVKLNGSGTVQWTRTIDTDDNYDWAYQVIQTSDGGYAFAGYNVVSTYGQTFSGKLDATGAVTYTRHIGAGATVDVNAGEEAYGIVQNPDGTYVLAGYTGISGTAGADDIYLVKLNTDFTVNTTGWPRRLGSTGNDNAYGMIYTSDNKYVVVGSTASPPASGTDVYIAKLNTDGTTAWEHTIGGAGTDVGNAVVEAADGGYVIAGYTNSFGETGGASNDAYIVKFSSAGTLQWTRTVGAGNREYANGICLTSDGGFAIAGYRRNDPDSDIMLIKIDSNGNISPSCTNSSGGAVGNPSFTNTTRSSNNGNGNNANTELTNNNSTGGLLLNTSCGSTFIPVELTSFNGKVCEEKGCVELTWQTATEINNDYFSIERSADGISWNEIGKVSGGGNSSSILNYEFVDELFPSPAGEGLGVRYYRLKQTDYDASFEYYGPISVFFSASDEWNLILQNISDAEELNGTLILPEENNVQIEIIDLQGRRIKNEFLVASKGANLLQLDLKNIKSGMYFIKAYNNKKAVTKRFVKHQ